MLPESITKLLAEIILLTPHKEEILQKLRENPEECLVSLLTEIKDDLPDPSSVLRNTVEKGAAGVLDRVKEGRALRARQRAKERATK